MAKCSVCKEMDVYENNKCILHYEKDGWSKDWNSKKEEIELFWKEITKKIKSKTKLINDKTYNPHHEQAQKDRQEYLSYKFYTVYFPYSINDPMPFWTLNDKIDKNQHLNLNFINCHFLGEVDFHYIFKAKNINFNNCHFNTNLEFKNNSFDNLFMFQECHVYEKATFENIIFETATSFIETNFYKELEFIHTKFESQALFNSIQIQSLDINNTFFKDEANFLGIKNKDGKKLEPKNIENRETARIIKHSFEKIDNIIEANKFYALEMEKRGDELNNKNNEDTNFFESLVFKFHKISSNHSQDWMKVLLWIIFIGYISAFVDHFSSPDCCQTYIFLNNFNFNIILFFMLITYLAFIYIIIYNHTNNNNIQILLTSFFILYPGYSLITYDYFLSDVAKTLNPFSIMRGTDDINMLQLICKVIIAYLIYQFIISIRQNTRRK